MTTEEEKLAKANERIQKLLKQIEETENNMRKAASDNGKDYMGERDPTAENKTTKRGRKNGR
jgi:hypothetical protein